MMTFIRTTLEVETIFVDVEKQQGKNPRNRMMLFSRIPLQIWLSIRVVLLL